MICMMKRCSILLLLLLGSFCFTHVGAQTASSSDNLAALPAADRSLSFMLSDSGVYKPITWGLDMAWISEDNIRRGINFMGATNISIVRSSFTPNLELVDGALQASQLEVLQQRLNILKLVNKNAGVVLNCDQERGVIDYYKNSPSNWAKLIEITAKLHAAQGRKIISVSPYNEPDYSAWGQGSATDFYNIEKELRSNSYFDTIRISGGNTLNCDQALTWYNKLKPYVNEGNTHQLAGSFDNFANFFKTVRADGNYATDDELHNVMECMVGVEYGMQTGIWWGTAEYTRGEFVKASYGHRIAYAEHRPNWTAASVYRTPEGKLEAFGGTSERQAVTTTYRFVSPEQEVFFDGYGPTREYMMTLPGGTGYQVGQTNAECVVQITSGEDVQPVIGGRYIIENRYNKRIIEVADGSSSDGAVAQLASNKHKEYQQWDVTPVSSRVGGDFSYYSILAAHSGKTLDLLNFSLNNGASIITYTNSFGSNQQWYLEYAGDGWFYIRSRHSSKCLQVNTSNGTGLMQSAFTGAKYQQWRFLPVDAVLETTAPATPEGLAVTARPQSIRLDWSAGSETDIASYTVARATSPEGPYNTIGRYITTPSFVDGKVLPGKVYYYKVKAVDYSLNSSAYSDSVVAASTEEKSLSLLYMFEGNTRDTTLNLNHAAAYGEISYGEGKTGDSALYLDGAANFLQLAAEVAQRKELTVSAWVNLRSTGVDQHIFDFGTDATHYLYLTPRTSSRYVAFGICNGGSEQTLTAPAINIYQWTHLAVTLGNDSVAIYINGVRKAATSAITLRPSDIVPLFNYIGRSNSSTTLFKGYIDDFRVYNYALSPQEVEQMANETYDGITPVEGNQSTSTLTLYDMAGHRLFTRTSLTGEKGLSLNGLARGIYLLKIRDGQGERVKKIVVK